MTGALHSSQVGVPRGVQEEIQACVKGPEGARLMAASAAEVKARGVKSSCTVMLDGAPRCVRDGGEWRDCPGGARDEDFVRSICAALSRKGGGAALPPACGAQKAAAG